MYVITAINTKGGCGKTTTVLTLATALARIDYKVTVIDTDKAKNVTGWYKKRDGARLEPVFNLHSTTNSEGLTDYIDELDNADDVDFCIIDTEGAAGEIQGAILSRTDLAIISLMPSEMDADQARQTLGIIKKTGHAIGREIPFVFSFCRTNPAIVLVEQRMIQQDLDDANLPRLPCTLVERSAFRQMFRTGQLVEELKLTKEQKNKALANIQYYAIDVIKHLMKLEEDM